MIRPKTTPWHYSIWARLLLAHVAVCGVHAGFEVTEAAHLTMPLFSVVDGATYGSVYLPTMTTEPIRWGPFRLGAADPLTAPSGRVFLQSNRMYPEDGDAWFRQFGSHDHALVDRVERVHFELACETHTLRLRASTWHLAAPGRMQLEQINQVTLDGAPLTVTRIHFFNTSHALVVFIDGPDGPPQLIRFPYLHHEVSPP